MQAEIRKASFAAVRAAEEQSAALKRLMDQSRVDASKTQDMLAQVRLCCNLVGPTALACARVTVQMVLQLWHGYTATCSQCSVHPGWTTAALGACFAAEQGGSTSRIVAQEEPSSEAPTGFRNTT
jgi:hypothetical protein